MVQLQNVSRVRVLFDGQLVGKLAMTSDGLMAFEYNSTWISTGFSISPLSLPLEKRVFVARPEPLDGVFGVFDDSLPDGWGRLLVDRMLSAHGVNPRTVSPLVRLSIVGASGMGALTYEPESIVPAPVAGLTLDQMAQGCAGVLASNDSDDLDTLFALGGSSGGARPKVLLTIDGQEWIVKFASSVDDPGIGAKEYRISLAARESGLEMPQTHLFPSERCDGYFGVRRFDRMATTGSEQVRRVHMVSAGGLLETSHRIPNLDYDLLMRLTMHLTHNEKDIEALYRLMCFNVFIGNRDDHAKNFSYLYDVESGAWRLSPAYDLTCNPGMYGERATTVNGKGRAIGLDDLIAVGTSAGIRAKHARATAQEIRRIVEEHGLLDEE